MYVLTIAISLFAKNTLLFYVPQCGTYVHHCGMYVHHCGMYVHHCGT